MIPDVHHWLLSVGKFLKIVLADEGEWKSSIQGSDVVVNLVGMPICTRWTP